MNIVHSCCTEELDVQTIDDNLLVVNKPTGMLSVPGRTPDKQDCLLVRIQKRFPEALVVHRLDRDTSGLILFARNRTTQSSLARMFQEGKIGKRYTAWVEGQVTSDSGRIEAPIERVAEATLPPRYRICETGRASTTEWFVVERDEEKTVLDLRPRTGRSHQLRVHCQGMGHPIVGDPIYGEPADRMYLHATQLRFLHPCGNGMLEFEAPLPF